MLTHSEASQTCRVKSQAPPRLICTKVRISLATRAPGNRIFPMVLVSRDSTPSPIRQPPPSEPTPRVLPEMDAAAAAVAAAAASELGLEISTKCIYNNHKDNTELQTPYPSHGCRVEWASNQPGGYRLDICGLASLRAGSTSELLRCLYRSHGIYTHVQSNPKSSAERSTTPSLDLVRSCCCI
jgi:hypothetical protein